MKPNELKAEIVRNDMTMNEFADKIGIGRVTFWRRMENPDSFTLGEIIKMSNLLKIDMHRVGEIFFSEIVS